MNMTVTLLMIASVAALVLAHIKHEIPNLLRAILFALWALLMRSIS